MAKLHGKNGIVYLGSGAAAAVVLSQAAEWSIDVDFDLASVPVLGDVWDSKVKGISKWSGSLDGTYDTAQNLAFDAMATANSVPLYVYPDRSQVTRYYYGFCWPKLSVKGGTGDPVTFTAGFDGDGQLSKN